MHSLVKNNSTREWLIEAGLKQESVDEACQQILRFIKREGSLRATAGITGYMGSGNRKAEVMIVSDAPDESEQQTKILGFSDYGIVLTIMLNKLGIEFDDVYWTTAVKDDTESITFKKLQEHRRHIQEEVIYINPSIIISLGTASISALLNEKVHYDKVDDEVGYNVHDNLPDVPIIPLPHPKSYIFNDGFQNEFSTSWKKLKMAFS